MVVGVRREAGYGLSVFLKITVSSTIVVVDTIETRMKKKNNNKTLFSYRNPFCRTS